MQTEKWRSGPGPRKPLGVLASAGPVSALSSVGFFLPRVPPSHCSSVPLYDSSRGQVVVGIQEHYERMSSSLVGEETEERPRNLAASFTLLGPAPPALR